jgi:uncharacterized protein YbdZ (MbtH family)
MEKPSWDFSIVTEERNAYAIWRGPADIPEA